MLRITHTRGRMAPAIEHFAAQRLRIGSAPGNELLFAAGDRVAPAHAEIRHEGGVYYVIDLGAGTFVRRARVGRQPLQSGDLVSLGSPDGPEFRVEILNVPQRGPSGPDADGRVDLDTAERMVADAVIRATAGEDKTTAIVARKVAEAQRRAARHNRLLTAGLLVAFAGLLFTAVTVWRSHLAATSLSADVGHDRDTGSKGKTKIKGTIPTRVYTGREIYDENRTALYVIGYLLGNKVGGVCTAFAIKPSVLATNAHCVNSFRSKGGTPVVTQNDSGGKVRFRILAAQSHPGYKTGSTSANSPDVGLLRIEGTMPKTVTLANDAELHALGPGDDVFVLGFPGRVMDPISPSATFLQGHLGRMVGMGEQAASVDDATLIQHDAVTRGGNSGSPIFNQYGHVIGVHAAHLDEEDEIKVDGQKTTVVKSSPFRIGMRVDLLNGVRAP
jgi:V8-like Glu-specific endopeptidase